MTLFALTLSHAVRADLRSFVKGFFILFVFISFISVAGYAAKQIRYRRLVPKANGPLPLEMPALSGWLFLISVVGLIYLQSILYAIVVLVGIAGAIADSRRTVSAQFGFERVPGIKVATWSLLVFGAIMLVETPLTEFSSWALDALRMPHPDQQSVDTFRQYNDPFTILWFIFQAVFLFPVVEELFFRGFLLTFLQRYTSTWMAIVLSAGIFAFAHLNLGAALPLWFLGIVLAIVYEHTGSLLVPIGIHACFNLATALSLLIDKGNSS